MVYCGHMKSCLTCKKSLTPRQKKYCSNQCQADHQYQIYIRKWKEGKVDGSRGIQTRNISRNLKRYLIEKYGEECSECRWNKKHPLSGHSPLEVDHVDGNSENNTENNLRLLCPNCHSLTTTYKNHNQGKGRVWRKQKYVRN
jgi:predicted HNH restriction endonuclease